MATDLQERPDPFWDREPKTPYKRGCYVCARYELMIAVRKAEQSESVYGWEASYAMHVDMAH